MNREIWKTIRKIADNSNLYLVNSYINFKQNAPIKTFSQMDLFRKQIHPRCHLQNTHEGASKSAWKGQACGYTCRLSAVSSYTLSFSLLVMCCRRQQGFSTWVPAAHTGDYWAGFSSKLAALAWPSHSYHGNCMVSKPADGRFVNIFCLHLGLTQILKTNSQNWLKIWIQNFWKYIVFVLYICHELFEEPSHMISFWSTS